MKEYLPYFLALSAGVFTAIEVGINSRLGKIVTPTIATLHSLIIGMLFFFTINLLQGTLSQYKNVFKVNPFLLIGGVFGALIIYIATKTIPRLGITTTLILVVSAEVLTGLFIDCFLTKEQVFSTMKIAGLIFVLIGIYILVD
jgi:bacterial/archaeal transporter family-2 protein